MRALVTGGAGFIGSHLCDHLVGRGDEVWCVDNLHLGRHRNIAHLERQNLFHFLEQDVLDRDRLAALFAEAKFDAVFHLAANSDIAAGNADTELDFRLNELTTIAVLDTMRRHGTRRLFFASTSAIFGEATGGARRGLTGRSPRSPSMAPASSRPRPTSPPTRIASI